MDQKTTISTYPISGLNYIYISGADGLVLKIRLITALIVLLATDVAFTDPPKLLENYRETVLDIKEVSGHFDFVLGMMSGAAVTHPSRSIVVWLPDSHGQRLCITIRSIDAQYEAVGQYDLVETTEKSYTLDDYVPASEHRQLYDSYGAGELVLDARIGTSCGDHETLVRVPANWTNAIESGSVGFFVNSGEHEGRIIIPSLDDPDRLSEFECGLIKTDRSLVAFHSYCSVDDASGLDISQAWFELWRFGEPIDSQALDILLPAKTSPESH